MTPTVRSLGDYEILERFHFAVLDPKAWSRVLLSLCQEVRRNPTAYNSRTYSLATGYCPTFPPYSIVDWMIDHAESVALFADVARSKRLLSEATIPERKLIDALLKAKEMRSSEPGVDAGSAHRVPMYGH